ncbi:unnamed protein product, partial [Adineta ricciae]
IGEVDLNIQINNIVTTITAAVATCLVTDLLLGTDWINIYVQSLDIANQTLTIHDAHDQFTTTSLLRHFDSSTTSSVSLVHSITISKYSTSIVSVKIPSLDNTTVIFEPSSKFTMAPIFIPDSLINVRNHLSVVSITNHTDHSYTIPQNTCLGTVPIASIICTVSSSNTSAYHFLSDVSDSSSSNSIWKYGKSFDVRYPSKINFILENAIDTGFHRPVYTTPYRRSPKDHEILNDQTAYLYSQNIIEHSTSPWCSPVVLVKKKDGETRCCVDYRKLNAIIVKDSFSLPRIDDIFDQVSRTTYFTKLDFKSGYFQISLAPDDRPKTAFSTRDNHYQFTVLPQGVKNGLPTVEKCTIASERITYLGHHIHRGHIRPSTDNVHDLLDSPIPTTPQATFRFVKAAEYFRKFITNFSRIAAPLYKYTPSSRNPDTIPATSSWTLSPIERAAYDQLKHILSTDLVLHLPNYDLPFKIQTDASKVGVGAVLLQTSPEGDRPVCYLSTKFSPTQQQWPVIEQECYAIVVAVEQWRHYLHGRHFTVESDHKPLESFTIKSQLNDKCERWRLKLQSYDFTIRHISGTTNAMADFFISFTVIQTTDDFLVTPIINIVATRSRTKQTVLPNHATIATSTDNSSSAALRSTHCPSVDDLAIRFTSDLSILKAA